MACQSVYTSMKMADLSIDDRPLRLRLLSPSPFPQPLLYPSIPLSLSYQFSSLLSFNLILRTRIIVILIFK